jgi:hypothetical protein
MKRSIYDNPHDYVLKYSNYMKDYSLIHEWANLVNGTILDLGWVQGDIDCN